MTDAKRYHIMSRSQGAKVGEAATLKGARRAVDRRDNDYGGYDHYVIYTQRDAATL